MRRNGNLSRAHGRGRGLTQEILKYQTLHLVLANYCDSQAFNVIILQYFGSKYTSIHLPRGVFGFKFEKSNVLCPSGRRGGDYNTLDLAKICNFPNSLYKYRFSTLSITSY